jgi:small-conductance mechanosensitive channel
MKIKVCGVLLLVAALAAPASFSLAEEKTAGGFPDAAPPEIEIATAPVELDGAVLFRVRGVSAFPAEQRAAGIRSRIEALARDPGFRADALRTAETDLYVAIMAGDKLVMGVLDADARLEQVTRRELAASYRTRISAAIQEYRRARSHDVLLRGGLYALAATAVLAAIVLGVLWLSRRLDAAIERRVRHRIPMLGIQSFEVVRAERIWGAMRGALHALRALAILAVVFVYLHFVLGLFPWTRALAGRLADLVVGPLETMGRALLAHIPSLVFLAILFYVVRFVLRLLRLFFDGVARGTISLSGFEAEWARPTYKMARLAVVAFGVIVAYPYIPGSQSAAFKGVTVFLGVVFSLGSSSAISNVIAGYSMTYRRAFKLGDRVRIADMLGDVIEVRLQVTHLRTIKNEEVIIPNSLILNSHVVNYSSLARQEGLILHTAVTIGYDAPWRTVHALLIAAARATPGILERPEPFVLQTALNDFFVTYEINAHTAEPNRMIDIYSALHQNIQDKFNEAGVEIMSPHFTSLRDGNTIAIPGQYHPPGYQPPAFRVRGAGDDFGGGGPQAPPPA